MMLKPSKAKPIRRNLCIISSFLCEFREREVWIRLIRIRLLATAVISDRINLVTDSKGNSVTTQCINRNENYLTLIASAALATLLFILTALKICLMKPYGRPVKIGFDSGLLRDFFV